MYEITLAAADLDGIAALLQSNSPSQGGTLTGEFSRDVVARMAASGAPVVVAHRDGQVVGVLFSSARDNPGSPPPVQAMLAAWPGRADAYVYGPVCIAESERGRGLLSQLYAALRAHYPGSEAVLFIRSDNAASLSAHQRLGMRKVADFTLDSIGYIVLSDCAP
ncbi:GNAT family N-acetyltransferase [Undibacterium sp.]|jgi:L-amino acid N-acyltransferase YncA|uniref:GNAT family N-acetyltransferase n=1 Tax=Undibacterium sp. TaxID=1914977 RepID=UPI002C68F487|nr:GNAT family N-acetyltransferase [Undibacterium sp.]HTD04669.1 GNAT family N-acetyltransferase [Undibacterium sp.]